MYKVKGLSVLPLGMPMLSWKGKRQLSDNYFQYHENVVLQLAFFLLDIFLPCEYMQICILLKCHVIFHNKYNKWTTDYKYLPINVPNIT